MSHLLDVNVLVAWGWKDHADHNRAVRWIARCKTRKGVVLLTSPIPEIGFIRISVQRSLGQVTVREAAEVLAGMLDTLEERHRFLPDDVGASAWPGWCRSAARTTDAHLIELARRHGLKLATLDTEIPGAFLLPEKEDSPAD